MLDISSAEIIKKKRVITKASKTWKGPISFNETSIFYDIFVLYLLNLNDLDGRRCADNINWFSKIYQIHESLI